MRSRWRLLCVLLCLALLCACGKKPPAPTQPEPEPEVEAPHIVSLVCSDGELTLRFHVDENGSWVWTDNPGFSLNGALVDGLAADAAALDGIAPLADAEGPEVYGLYDARKYVTTSYSDGRSVTWRFGSQSEDGMYYASTESDPERVCLASGELLERVGQGIYPMAVLPELPVLTPDRIREAAVTREGVTVHYTVIDGQWRRDSRDATGQPETHALSALLASPALARCVDYAPSDGAAELCGLKPPVMVLQVTYDDGAYKLTVGTRTEDGAFCFVTVDDDPTIYLMDAAPLDALSGGGE